MIPVWTEIEPGERVEFVPSARQGLRVQGMFRDAVKSTGGAVGCHIYAPEPGDTSRVLRVWESDGRLSRL